MTAVVTTTRDDDVTVSSELHADSTFLDSFFTLTSSQTFSSPATVLQSQTSELEFTELKFNISESSVASSSVPVSSSKHFMTFTQRDSLFSISLHEKFSEESESSIIKTIPVPQLIISSTDHDIELISTMSTHHIMDSVVVSIKTNGILLPDNSDIDIKPSTSKLPSMTSAKETDILKTESLSQSDEDISAIAMVSVAIGSSADPFNRTTAETLTSTSYIFPTQSVNALPTSSPGSSIHGTLFSLHSMPILRFIFKHVLSDRFKYCFSFKIHSTIHSGI